MNSSAAAQMVDRDISSRAAGNVDARQAFRNLYAAKGAYPYQDQPIALQRQIVLPPKISIPQNSVSSCGIGDYMGRDAGSLTGEKLPRHWPKRAASILREEL